MTKQDKIRVEQWVSNCPRLTLSSRKCSAKRTQVRYGSAIGTYTRCNSWTVYSTRSLIDHSVSRHQRWLSRSDQDPGSDQTQKQSQTFNCQCYQRRKCNRASRSNSKIWSWRSTPNAWLNSFFKAAMKRSCLKCR